MSPLIELAITETPAVIAALQRLFALVHPGDPVPTNEEVIAAFHSAFQSSLDKDNLWLTVHPEETP